MLTVGVAPLIGLDYGHLRDPRWQTEARWCLDRQHAALWFVTTYVSRLLPKQSRFEYTSGVVRLPAFVVLISREIVCQRR